MCYMVLRTGRCLAGFSQCNLACDAENQYTCYRNVGHGNFAGLGYIIVFAAAAGRRSSRCCGCSGCCRGRRSGGAVVSLIGAHIT